MRCLAVSAILLLLSPSAGTGAAARTTDGAPPPRLDYRLDGYQDSQVTYGSGTDSYSGRWVGTWYGADGRRYSGTYEGGFRGTVRKGGPLPADTISPSPPPSRETADPALYGSGRVVDGWYYPPSVVTKTVIEYAPAR